MKDPKTIRESAMADLRHLFRDRRRHPFVEPKRIRYDTAREMALSWGILNLREIEALEHEVKNRR